VQLKVVSDIRELSRVDWDALVPENAPPFLEWTWLSALETSGAVGRDSGWLPLHLACFEDHVLVAAMPVYAKTNSEGEFVFDWAWADAAPRFGVRYYPKLIAAVPFTPVTGPRVLVRDPAQKAMFTRVFAAALDELAREMKASSVHVLFPTEEEATLFEEAGWLHRKGIQFHFENQGYATFEDFLAHFPTKKRTQIRRERSQVARDGLTLEHITKESMTPELAGVMYELYLTTVDKFRWGRRYLNRPFFEIIARDFAGRLDWVLAKRGSEVVAGAFNAKKGDRLYGRYWGAFEEVKFLHFNVCYYEGVEQCLREKLAVFEPGAGGEHKRARGFLPTVTHSVHRIYSPRFSAAIADFVEREGESVDRVVREEREAFYGEGKE